MFQTIPLNKLVSSPRNVRRHGDPTADAELKASIASFRDAFEQGQAPGASLHELNQAGGSFKIRTTSPKRTAHS